MDPPKRVLLNPLNQHEDEGEDAHGYLTPKALEEGALGGLFDHAWRGSGSSDDAHGGTRQDGYLEKEGSVGLEERFGFTACCRIHRLEAL